ncbi:MAG: hypothetical protein ACFFBP_03015 [Promethearchaeota archaeon]
MEKKYKIISVITVYVISIIVYVLFFSQFIPYLNLIVIGSLTVISTGTLYAIIHESNNQYKREKKLKVLKQTKLELEKSSEFTKKSIQESPEVIGEYLEAFPYIEDYVESDVTYEQVPIINEIIFSDLNQEVLKKINLLNLSQIEKLQFIRELLYYEPEERDNLIENMLENRDKIDEDVIYSVPLKTLELADKFRVHVISLVEPGEKKKIIIIESLDMIIEIKKKVGVLFDYNLEDFHLTTGGIMLDETLQIKDYFIEDDDEIVLIPIRK